MSTTPVTISINVVDNGSAALGKAQAQVAALGAAGTAAGKEFAARMGAAGAAGTRMAGQFRDASRTVVGASHEMGLGVSRYFAGEILERFPQVVAAIKSVGAAFFALGAIEIGAHMVGELSDVYSKLFDVDSAIDEFRKKTAEAAQQKLFDIASLETTNSLLAQANREVDQLAAKKKAAGAEGWGGGAAQYLPASLDFVGAPGNEPGTPYTPQDAEKQAAAMVQQQKAAEKLADLDHQQRLAQIQAQEGFNGTALQGYGRINAALDLEKQKSSEVLRYTQEQEHTLQKQQIAYRDLLIAQGKTVEAQKVQIPAIDPNAGRAAKEQADHAGQLRAQGEEIVMARAAKEEIIGMQNEATNARLRGEDVYQSRAVQAIEAVMLKQREHRLLDAEALAEENAIGDKYHAEKMKRFQEEDEQLRHMQAEAQIAGLTGISRIQAEGAERERVLRYQASLKGPEYEQRILPGEIAANAQTTGGEAKKSINEYYARLQQMNDEWNTSQLQGYARIEAETIRHLDTLKKDFEKEFPGKDISSDQQSKDTMTNAWANADRERQRLHQETLLGLQKEETDAARALLQPWAAAEQQIIGQYNERIQKATQEYQDIIRFAKLSTEGRWLAEQDYQAKVQAARQLETAQMQKQAQSMRDELAGKLSGFFSDPSKFMEKQAESMMMKIIANWVMQLGDFQHNPALQMMFGMGPNLSAPVPARIAAWGGCWVSAEAPQRAARRHN